MAYYICRIVARPFETVVEDITAALSKQGFGLLSDIDVQATLKAKLDADIGKYRILGACNPGFAYEALKLEDKLGVMLPCNVIVREMPDGRTEVACIDPVVSMQRTGNDALASTAERVRERLAGALGQLGG